MTKKKTQKKIEKRLGKKPSQEVSNEKRRVNLKMDSDLVEFVFSYADRTGTTVTRLITNYFTGLRRREARRLDNDAEQI